MLFFVNLLSRHVYPRFQVLKGSKTKSLKKYCGIGLNFQVEREVSHWLMVLSGTAFTKAGTLEESLISGAEKGQN